MSGPDLSIGTNVMREMVRLAAFEVPGVLRVGHGGPVWRGLLAGRPVAISSRRDGIHVDVTVVARPGHALVPLTRQVRSAVGATVERLLGLRLESVTVTVDGVGG
ncbi:MAG: Asp23/Gls24 family envelope stress response protein [Chloroflexota bacterium]